MFVGDSLEGGGAIVVKFGRYLTTLPSKKYHRVVLGMGIGGG